MNKMRVFHMLIMVLLLCCVIVVPVASAHAQRTTAMTGAFVSQQPVVAPLQPVHITVTVSGYQGTANLVLFDSKGTSVGATEFTIPPNGMASVSVIPRGSMGNHWAALFAGGQQIASGTIYRLEADTTIQTGIEVYDELFRRIRGFLANCTLDLTIDGNHVHGYRSPDSPLLWLRDHYYQGRGFKYFERDVTSLIDAFRQAQLPDGSFPDFVARPDYNIPAYRTPVEADVEYLFVMAVYEAWQFTGDDQWLISNLEAMQRAMHYTTTNPERWDATLGLVKRPFTIDTWDFEYGATTIDPSTGNPAPRHWIDDQTRWGIFHGDNTGLVQALNMLAHIEFYVGQPEQGIAHTNLATAVIQQLNTLSWNGSFFRHHVKLQPWDVPGVDEESQLSLSNAYALTRNVLTIEQGQAILNEYRTRLSRSGNVSFAEWWSIDPPFPSGSFGMDGRFGENPGYYVNGGIMPLVGGELSRGAFRFGNEEYGFDILERYYALVKRTNASYLWYHPTGGPGASGIEVLSTDGWGSSAMLAGLMEGAAGIEDNSVRYRNVTISPRWSGSSLGVTHAYVVARYAASDGYVAYRWSSTPMSDDSTTLRLHVTGSGDTTHIRLLLPPGTKGVSRVMLNGQWLASARERVGTSQYIVVHDVPVGIVQLEVDVRL